MEDEELEGTNGDMICVCLYCGNNMNVPTAKQVRIFGQPNCCEENMVLLNRNKLFMLIKGLDNLKEKMEKEILRGMI